MKGIYLSQEGKEEIEKSLKILTDDLGNEYEYFKNIGKREILRQILSSATILPVEENWDEFILDPKDSKYVEKEYPNGVIIKPNKS